MAVAVFDADVLIGLLNRNDAHHLAATAAVQGCLASRSRLVISAVTYAEILVGPTRAGTSATVDAMLLRFGVNIRAVDPTIASSAADLRAQSGAGLPDALVVATAIHEQASGVGPVKIYSFDSRVIALAATLGF